MLHGEYNYLVQTVTQNGFSITNSLTALRTRRNIAAALRNVVVRLVMRFSGYEFSVNARGRYIICDAYDSQCFLFFRLLLNKL